MNELVTVLKALSDPTRLKILRFLTEEGLCVCELDSIIDCSQSAISQHLAKLKAAGLVIEHREGVWNRYQTIPDLKQHIDSLLGSFIDTPLNENPLLEFEKKKYDSLIRAEDRASSCAPERAGA